MYRQFDNPLMEEYVYKRRTERGTRMFSKEGGIKAPMKMVKEGGALGVLSDPSSSGRGCMSPSSAR